jgi:hypothetical protein
MYRTSSAAPNPLVQARRESSLPFPRDGVVFQRVVGGAVLLSTVDEIYFGLNGVGADVWELLPPVTGDLTELCARLVERYAEVTAEDVRGDVVDLLQALREAHLVDDRPHA